MKRTYKISSSDQPDVTEKDGQRFRLRLFITGYSLFSQKAINNLEQMCQTELSGNYEIEVIDVLENPELAEEEKIFATPTLIKLSPEPTERLIGDLSQKDVLRSVVSSFGY
jgi:circadian clock protein KaiB